MTDTAELQRIEPVLPIFDNPTPGQLLQLALTKDSGIEIIERITAMMEREREYQAKVSFDEALNRCQQQIGRIAPNQKRNDNGAWWADYAQLDRAIRPIYTAAGFSIGFSEVQPIHTGKVRIQGELARKGVSKFYFSEITPSTTGPKGNAMATPTDADAIAMSRAKRYILLDIFNIAVGIDKEEKAAIPQGESLNEKVVEEYIEALNNAPDIAALKGVFADAYSKAKALRDEAAKKQFTSVYEALKKQFAEGAR